MLCALLAVSGTGTALAQPLLPTDDGPPIVAAQAALPPSAPGLPASDARDPLVVAPGNVLPPTAVGPPSLNPDMTAVWRDGLFFESPRRSYSVHVGGILQFDGAWYSAGVPIQRYPGGIGALQDGVDIRRARIRTEGFLYKTVEFSLEVELSGGFNPTGNPAAVNNTFVAPGPTDMYAGLTDIPYLGTVRIGQQREPISLEHLNSARFLEFLERSPLFDLNPASAFNTGRSPGIMALRNWGPDNRIYGAIGAFKNITDVYGYGIGDGQYAVTGRLTGMVLWEPEAKRFWNVGGAMSHRDPVNGQVQVRVRNDIRNAPGPFQNVLANTGSISATGNDVYNLESAAVFGSLTLQSEYMANLVHGASVGTGPNMGTVLFQGWYTEALWFLTGESRTWRAGSATFDRVRPRDPVRFDNGVAKGLGAWEVGARYSYVDLTNKGLQGGRVNSVTLGLNWYWNPNAKVQFNYDYLYRDAVSNALAKGSVHSLGTRMAYDF